MDVYSFSKEWWVFIGCFFVKFLLFPYFIRFDEHMFKKDLAKLNSARVKYVKKNSRGTLVESMHFFLTNI